MNQKENKSNGITLEDFQRIGTIYSCRTEERSAYITKGTTGWLCRMSRPGYRNSDRYSTRKAALQSAVEFMNL